MIDLHTHILPGIDDGAKDLEMSLQMLRIQQEQGVDTVVLTPHFYSSRESSRRFLKRREEAAKTLAHAILKMSEEEQKSFPRKMVLGAEVAWVPNLAYDDYLDQMCLGSSKYMLLELPFEPWSEQMINQIYHLSGRTGITPVIAHLERYQRLQTRELFDEVIALGVPIQLGTDMLLHTLQRGRLLKLMQQGGQYILASDCHNLTNRKPNLFAAMELTKKKLGDNAVKKMQRQAEWILGY